MKKKLIYAALFIVVLLVVIFLFFLKGLQSRYVIKKDGVYYKGWSGSSGSFDNLLKSADPYTFKTLGNPFYGKDKERVYFQGNVVIGAEAQTFTLLDDFYAKDDIHAFYQGKLIETSDSRRFAVIDNDYSTDGIDIFYGIIPLKVRSAKNFKFISKSESDEKNGYKIYPWATDGYSYYYKNYRIPSDDYSHVEIYPFSQGVAKDRTWVYYLDRRINYNEKGEKLFDVDVPSFTCIDPYIDGGKDKFGCIEASIGRVKCEQ